MNANEENVGDLSSWTWLLARSLKSTADQASLPPPDLQAVLKEELRRLSSQLVRIGPPQWQWARP